MRACDEYVYARACACGCAYDRIGDLRVGMKKGQVQRWLGAPEIQWLNHVARHILCLYEGEIDRRVVERV